MDWSRIIEPKYKQILDEDDQVKGDKQTGENNVFQIYLNVTVPRRQWAKMTIEMVRENLDKGSQTQLSPKAASKERPPRDNF